MHAACCTHRCLCAAGVQQHTAWLQVQQVHSKAKVDHLWQGQGPGHPGEQVDLHRRQQTQSSSVCWGVTACGMPGDELLPGAPRLEELYLISTAAGTQAWL